MRKELEKGYPLMLERTIALKHEGNCQINVNCQDKRILISKVKSWGLATSINNRPWKVYLHENISEIFISAILFFAVLDRVYRSIRQSFSLLLSNNSDEVIYLLPNLNKSQKKTNRKADKKNFFFSERSGAVAQRFRNILDNSQ